MHYIHKDHLGSLHVVTNEAGQKEEEYSFGPWGRRRNPLNWSYTGVPADYLFDRGFTGHEHLDAFGLINMNGRVYDPLTARFLSPDPIVQQAGSSQSFNGYSYTLNNPQMYTDPGGYIMYPLHALNGTTGGGGGAWCQLSWPEIDNWTLDSYYASHIPHLYGELSGQVYYDFNTGTYTDGLGHALDASTAHANAANYYGGSYRPGSDYGITPLMISNTLNGVNRILLFIAIGKDPNFENSRFYEYKSEIQYFCLYDNGLITITNENDSILVSDASNGLPNINGVTAPWSFEHIIESTLEITTHESVELLTLILDDILQVTKGLGYISTGLSLANDTYHFAVKEDIDVIRYGYRIGGATLGTTLSIMGSEIAPLIGPSVVFYERSFDYARFQYENIFFRVNDLQYWGQFFYK